MRRNVEAARRLREVLVQGQQKLDVEQVKTLMECLGAVERENRTLREKIQDLEDKCGESWSLSEQAAAGKQGLRVARHRQVSKVWRRVRFSRMLGLQGLWLTSRMLL